MCPLRPATDLRLGEPLPHQLANQPRAPSSAICTFPSTLKIEAYAVLAPVSQGYSPPKSRSPTCYSPVRHFTHPLLGFLVRLACVKRAASVDSEPGSNSRLNQVLPVTRELYFRHSSFPRPLPYGRGSVGFERLRLGLVTQRLTSLRFVCVQSDCQRSALATRGSSRKPT